MAKFVFSALVTDARGKFGNAVFSANRSGKYLRTLVRPANPNTLLQQEARARFGSISQEWRGLTQDQRNAWNAATVDYIQQDVFGVNVRLSGFQLFAKVNNSLRGIRSFLPPVTDVVPPVSLPEIPLVISGANGTYQADYVGTPEGFFVALYATRGLSMGRMSAEDNEFRLIQTGDTAPALTALNFNAPYISEFGPMAPGTKVFLKQIIVAKANGQRSGELVEQIVVTNAPG